MRRLLPLLALLALALPAAAQEARATSESVRGVVELFTSQGCSSCPPADKLFARLAEDPGIVALAYHVDYWDYIGWRDPHGSRDNTDRQRAYARSFGTGAIYTPQAVVNGASDVVGSNAKALSAALTSDLRKAEGRPVLSLTVDGDRLHIAATGTSAPPAARAPVLMLVTYDERTETRVDKGENEGQTMVARKAVRDWRMLGMWEGKPMAVDLPLSTLRVPGRRIGCAAILQSVTEDGTPGPILAATSLGL